MRPVAASLERAARNVWQDRIRVGVAGLASLVLWYLLGQQVRIPQPLRLQIIPLGQNQSAPDRGLILHLPREVAFVAADPMHVEVMLEGSQKEIARLNGELKGVYEVPADICGDELEKQVVVPLRESQYFHFPRLDEFPTIRFVNFPTVTLTLAQRSTTTVVLNDKNLHFRDEELRRGIEVRFEPTVATLSGPVRLIDRIKADNGLLKLADVTESFREQALRNGVALNPRSVYLGDDMQEIENLELQTNSPLRVSFLRGEEYEDVELKEMLVGTLQFRGRERQGYELSWRPEKVLLALRVPRVWFDRGNDVVDLRREVKVFFDLAEWPAEDLLSATLDLRVHGLPEGASVLQLEPARVTVDWQRTENRDE